MSKLNELKYLNRYKPGPFKFEFKGFEVNCLNVFRSGLYGNYEVWKLVIKGPDFEKEFLTKTVCSQDTVNWVINKGVELINDILTIKPEGFNYYEFFDEIDERRFNKDE